MNSSLMIFVVFRNVLEGDGLRFDSEVDLVFDGGDTHLDVLSLYTNLTVELVEEVHHNVTAFFLEEREDVSLDLDEAIE